MSTVSHKKKYETDEQNKIYIIGGNGVGKTSLFQLIFVNNTDEVQPSEIGIVKSNYEYQDKIFTIKDLTDDEEFEYTNKLKSELEEVLIIFVLFAFNSKESLEKAKTLINFIKDNLTNNTEIQIVLLGNKYDLCQSLINDIEIDENEVKKYVESEDNLQYMNISCKTKLNVDKVINLINNKEIIEEKEDDNGIMNEEERKKKAKACICF